MTDAIEITYRDGCYNLKINPTEIKNAHNLFELKERLEVFIQSEFSNSVNKAFHVAQVINDRCKNHNDLTECSFPEVTDKTRYTEI